MARLTRKNIKVFAENATNNGIFGSLQANDPTTTNDVEQIQSLSAWSNGWDDATMTSEELPPLEEFQGIQYVVSYEQAYLMQEGIPEWASTVTYYKGCLAKEVTSTGFRIYNSLTDNNTGNLLSDSLNWKKVMDSDDVYAFDSTVVHKSGAETISGEKTFTGSLIFTTSNLITKQDNAMEGGQINLENPTNSSLTGNVSIDIYGNLMRFVGINSSQNTTIPLTLDLETNIAYATASDAIYSVVTTTGISKSSNGYFKLGNGLLIQWGRYTTVSGTDEHTISFSTPFSSATSYTIVKNYQSNHSTDALDKEVSFYNMTATGATTYSPKGDTSQISWLAIGY